MSQLPAGTSIDDRFVISEYVAMGGMGSVYWARQVGLDRDVAINVLHDYLLHDSGSLGRFEREAVVLQTLAHKDICLFFCYGLWQGDKPFIAMEFLSGRTLAQLIAAEGRLTWRHVLQIVLGGCPLGIDSPAVFENALPGLSAHQDSGSRVVGKYPDAAANFISALRHLKDESDRAEVERCKVGALAELAALLLSQGQRQEALGLMEHAHAVWHPESASGALRRINMALATFRVEQLLGRLERQISAVSDGTGMAKRLKDLKAKRPYDVPVYTTVRLAQMLGRNPLPAGQEGKQP